MNKWQKGILYSVITLIGTLALFLIVFYRSDIAKETLESKYFTPESHYLQMADAKVHYRLRGSGPTLLFIHGSFSSLHTWNDWEAELSKSHTTLSVDLPGHGLTGPNIGGDYSPDYYSKLLLALTDSLNFDTLTVIGNSLGGSVAWRMALDAPERVKKLVLIDPAGFKKDHKADTIPTKTPFIFRMAQWPIVSDALVYATPKFLFKYNIKQVYGNAESIRPEIIERYYELMLRQGNRKATMTRMQQKAQSRFDEIVNITQPTLILWGIKDRWIPVEQAYAFKEKVKQAELIVYPELGHIPMEEMPTITVNDALHFLRQ